ncbi:hypothetical protein SprV_0200885500 [Sparganum proliferum]
MDPLGTASSQPIFQAFCTIVGRNLPHGSKVQWPLEFENCLTDFDRVVCLWNLLIQPKEVAKSGAQVLGLRPSVPLCENSRKSDVLAAKFREIGNGFWRSKACVEANKYYNLALFHSLSNVEKALALGNRSCVLYHLGCYEESANDVTAALKLGFPPEKSDRLHIRAGQCFRHLGNFVKASEHFSQALQSVTDPGLRRLAVDGLVKCKAQQTVGLKVAWRCARGDFPASVQSAVHASNLTAASAGSTHLLSANTPSGTSVRLCDAGPTKGWTLETTRNVKPGEILLFDLPYASRLKRDCFLTHCYRCYRRCLNLIPCNGCCQVGFCSEECALAAMQPPDSSKSRLGLGYHVYECGGLPCFLLDNYAGWPKQVSAAGSASGDTSVGGADVSHLAAACVSDTPPALLVSAICKTGTHQAFAGSKARNISLAVFDPRDYIAASWLVANSAHRSMSDLWQRTVAAVFITCCLSVGGYPMDWTSRNLFVAPSSTTKVELPPATWVAACILYHLQAVPCNAHTYAETLLPKCEQGVSLTASSIRPLASCLYPTLSLVNHSCDPNVLRVSTGSGSCLLLALRPLPAGTELLDCYSAHYALQGRAERQADLLSQYCFSCACVACTEDWLTASALMQTPKSLVTLLCPNCGGRLSAEAPGQGPTPASDGCSCEDSVKVQTRLKYANVVEGSLATRMKTVTQLLVSLPLERIDSKLVASSVDWLKTVLGVNAENGLSGFLCRPASAWDLAQELFKLLIVIQTGNWCVEPAGSCVLTE